MLISDDGKKYVINILRLCKFCNKREVRNFYEWFNCNYIQAALCYGIFYRKLLFIDCVLSWCVLTVILFFLLSKKLQTNNILKYLKNSLTIVKRLYKMYCLSKPLHITCDEIQNNHNSFIYKIGNITGTQNTYIFPRDI